jgi:phage virion morphogenesis protein
MSASITIEYKDEGLSVLVQVLSRLQEHGQKFKPVFEDMGEYLIGSIQDRFDAQESPTGEPWQDLAPKTWRYKRIKKILTESSNLRSRNVYAATDQEVAVGNNVVYGAMHQFGGEVQQYGRSQLAYFKVHKKTGNLLPGFKKRRQSNFAKWVTLPDYTISIPARPYLGISESDAAELRHILEAHIQRLATP